MEIKKVKIEDSIGCNERNNFDIVQENNVFIYVVENGRAQKHLFDKRHNLVVNQGRFLLLQRLTGIPGLSTDYTDQAVKYLAVGDGASSVPCSTPPPETASDTDLVNKITPLPSASPVATFYLDLTNNIVYETVNRLRFSFTLDTTVYADGTRINELGLFGGNPSTNVFTLFARVTTADILITTTRTYLVDWWITLTVNIA